MSYMPTVRGATNPLATTSVAPLPSRIIAGVTIGPILGAVGSPFLAIAGAVQLVFNALKSVIALIAFVVTSPMLMSKNNHHIPKAYAKHTLDGLKGFANEGVATIIVAALLPVIVPGLIIAGKTF
jgi:hypothetical protein